jgi:hypothetical protein
LIITDHTETWMIDLPALHDSAIALSSSLVAGQLLAVSGQRIEVKFDFRGTRTLVHDLRS